MDFDDVGIMGFVEIFLAPIKECFKYFSIIVLTLNLVTGILEPYPIIVDIAVWGTIILYAISIILAIATTIIAKIADEDDEDENLLLNIISGIITVVCIAAIITACCMQTQILEFLQIERTIHIIQWIATCIIAGQMLEAVLSILPDIFGAFVAGEDY